MATGSADISKRFTDCRLLRSGAVFVRAVVPRRMPRSTRTLDVPMPLIREHHVERIQLIGLPVTPSRTRCEQPRTTQDHNVARPVAIVRRFTDTATADREDDCCQPLTVSDRCLAAEPARPRARSGTNSSRPLRSMRRPMSCRFEADESRHIIAGGERRRRHPSSAASLHRRRSARSHG